MPREKPPFLTGLHLVLSASCSSPAFLGHLAGEGLGPREQFFLSLLIYAEILPLQQHLNLQWGTIKAFLGTMEWEDLKESLREA